jgi:hypothetical protein
MNVERIDSEDLLDAWPSRPDVVLFWEKSHYSGNMAVEDHSDKAIFCSDSPLLESKFI